jgi:hypothetical protein
LILSQNRDPLETIDSTTDKTLSFEERFVQIWTCEQSQLLHDIMTVKNKPYSSCFRLCFYGGYVFNVTFIPPDLWHCFHRNGF